MKRLLLALTLLAAPAAAQEALEVKTIELKHLKPVEAVKLLRPYLVNAAGMVTEVSEKLPIITIRDVPASIAKMEQVLAKYDHSPAVIRLVFQLIEADTGPRLVAASNTRGQVPVDLDSTLRSVLRFPSYRLLSQGVATVGAEAYVSQEMGDAGDDLTYALLAKIEAIRLSETNNRTTTGSVRMDVSLSRAGFMRGSYQKEGLIGTSLDVPLGNTVVLGTSTPRGRSVALILTVRPELVTTGK